MLSCRLGAPFAIALLTWGFVSTASAPANAEEPKKAAPAPRAEAAAATPPGAPEVKKETTDAEGEKSYQFGAVEVEGRLKAPQILYFVRRVRAELKSGQLGHRSFLPELRDTRRSEALR